MTPAPDLPLALVAASDPALCAALADAVRRAEFAVATACDGATAWEAFAARRPALLLVDLGLTPGAADGLDAIALCDRVCRGASTAAARGEDADAWSASSADVHGPNTHHADARGAEAEGAAALGASADDVADDARVPFVIVTLPRYGPDAGLEAALAAGADDYLTTPPSGRNVAARLSIARRRMAQAAAARRAEHALARARWLPGIGETSIALQHEINNPLAALLGHAALLEQELELPSEPGEARELAQVVTEQAQRIATVMKRLAALRDPRSVEYFGGARMLDLSRSALGTTARPEDGPGDGGRAD